MEKHENHEKHAPKEHEKHAPKAQENEKCCLTCNKEKCVASLLTCNKENEKCGLTCNKDVCFCGKI